jgi:hypothetical protein
MFETEVGAKLCALSVLHPLVDGKPGLKHERRKSWQAKAKKIVLW